MRQNSYLKSSHKLLHVKIDWGIMVKNKGMKMKFELEEEFIELFKLLKVTGVAESGGQAKMLIEEGAVKRNGEVELRKRAKIFSGEKIEVVDEVIEVESVLK